MSKRIQEISEALEKLELMKNNPAFAGQIYAINANIEFLRAARSWPRFVWWLLTKGRKLDGARLLELTDFPVPEWDIKMHKRLIEIQRRDKPGLVKPLVEAIVKFVTEADRDLVVGDLGAGGMEVDRQVALRVLNSSFAHQLTILAIDKSPTTRQIAKENLADIAKEVEIVETGVINRDQLETLQKNSTKRVLIVLATNDIFDLPAAFPPKYFNLVYHSLFKHHLSDGQKEKLDRVIQQTAQRMIEFDGYKSFFPHLLIQSVVAWSSPIFLNGTVFSMLRYGRKNNIFTRAVFCNKTAHYLLSSIA